jgi:hypothetical protein
MDKFLSHGELLEEEPRHLDCLSPVLAGVKHSSSSRKHFLVFRPFSIADSQGRLIIAVDEATVC